MPCWSRRRLIGLSSVIFISRKFISMSLTITTDRITGINLGFSLSPLITWEWGRKSRRGWSIFSLLIQWIQSPLLFILFLIMLIFSYFFTRNVFSWTNVGMSSWGFHVPTTVFLRHQFFSKI